MSKHIELASNEYQRLGSEPTDKKPEVYKVHRGEYVGDRGATYWIWFDEATELKTKFSEGFDKAAEGADYLATEARLAAHAMDDFKQSIADIKLEATKPKPRWMREQETKSRGRMRFK